jgi:UDP-GlcNAc:undecaprenyl-phosphate GlcNAc-1-phosphate transferase
MPIRLTDLLAVALSFAAALALTPLARAAARRLGFVARPKGERWHTRPTALMGGVAIFAAVGAVELVMVPMSAGALAVLGAATLLFVVGLVDDLVELKPYQKLSAQVMAATALVSSGLTLPWTGSSSADMAVTLLWVVGITNAVNLLDNMDGLAAGVSAIASAFLALNFLDSGRHSEALMVAVFGSALLGFLAYNSNPASIFMGDCGSMFLGSFLAGAALLNPAGGRSRTFLPVLAVPVLTLFIPIFDTLFVTILRKLAGRPVSRGGRDHTSHRLVALGLSERGAVWMLYAFAAATGLLGLLARHYTPDVSLAAITGFALTLSILGVHLAGVRVYDEAEVRAARSRPLVAFLVDLSYKRRIFEVLLDVVLIVLCYHAAYVTTFGPLRGEASLRQFARVVPILVAVKLATFLAFGVYRGLWRYVSLDTLVLYGKAVPAASAASVLALVFAFRFAGLSRVVFVLDGLLLLTLLAGSRLAFRLMRGLLPGPPETRPRRVLIFGAGDAGELLARELLNNPSRCCVPVGFADDDPLKAGRFIHGLRVLGGNGSFLSICRQSGAEEVVISSGKIPPGRVEEIARACGDASIPLRRMRIEIETLDHRPGPETRPLANRPLSPDPYPV